jgi:hypothetical protein
MLVSLQTTEGFLHRPTRTPEQALSDTRYATVSVSPKLGPREYPQGGFVAALAKSIDKVACICIF